MKNCPDCGCSAADTTLNCPDCGRSLSSAHSAGQSYAPVASNVSHSVPPSNPPTTPSQSWEAKLPDGTIQTYSDKDKILESIMSGATKGEFLCRVVGTQDKNNPKKEPKWKTVETSFDVFRPVRAHLWKGAGIGAAIGLVLFFGFKIIDTGAAALH